jgi:acid phosphatase family membrane protein YuiD
LSLKAMPESYIAKIGLLADSVGQTHWPSLVVAASTLVVMLVAAFKIRRAAASTGGCDWQPDCAGI